MKDFEGNQCLRNSSLAAGEKTKKKKKGYEGKALSSIRANEMVLTAIKSTLEKMIQ